MRWLEEAITESYRPSEQLYRLDQSILIGRPRIRRRIYTIVGMLGRYPVYSAICFRRYQWERLKQQIQGRLQCHRRVLPLPN